VDAKLTIPRARLHQGLTEIKVVCYNAEGGRGQAETSVEFYDAARGKPDLYALCVGINNYRKIKGFGPEIKDLRLAVKDAEVMAEVFRQHTESRTFRHSRVDLVPQKEASAGEILRRLEALGKKVKPDDWLVVFLSGHGRSDDEPGSFAYICANSDRRDSKSQLGAAALHRALAGIRCRKLILLDACRSGDVKSPPDRDLSRDGGDFLIFTACKGYQSALEPKAAAVRPGGKLLDHGLFTQGLLAALGEPAKVGKDGRQAPITARELADTVSATIEELLGPGSQDTQEPDFLPERARMPRVRVLSRPRGGP
jgi:hypothetical protein